MRKEAKLTPSGGVISNMPPSPPRNILKVPLLPYRKAGEGRRRQKRGRINTMKEMGRRSEGERKRMGERKKGRMGVVKSEGGGGGVRNESIFGNARYQIEREQKKDIFF